MICDPAPPRYRLNLILLPSGSTNTIGIRFVVLPDGYYGSTDIAEKQIAKVNDAFDGGCAQEGTLRKQLVSAPKPLVYTVDSMADAFRIASWARCNQMKIIYEANQQLIKNPNIISDGMKLNIPKLK